MTNKKKPNWDRRATTEDVFNAMATYAVIISLWIIFGYIFYNDIPDMFTIIGAIIIIISTFVIFKREQVKSKKS